MFIENFIHSCYGSAGQRCLAGSIVAAVPVISKKAKQRIENYIQIGIDQGSNLVLDGRNPKVADEIKNGACIFTQSQYYTEKFIAEADAGMIGVNVGVCVPHPYLPFGGIKDSHLGTNKVQGKDGIAFFTQNKVATIRHPLPVCQMKRSAVTVIRLSEVAWPTRETTLYPLVIGDL